MGLSRNLSLQTVPQCGWISHTLENHTQSHAFSESAILYSCSQNPLVAWVTQATHSLQTSNNKQHPTWHSNVSNMLDLIILDVGVHLNRHFPCIPVLPLHPLPSTTHALLLSTCHSLLPFTLHSFLFNSHFSSRILLFHSVLILYTVLGKML